MSNELISFWKFVISEVSVTLGTIPYTQSGRMMAISTPLGEHMLLLERLAIDEAINRLFTIEAQVKSQRDDLQAGDLIGASVDFSLKLKEGGWRWWNGFVTGLHEGSLTTRGTRAYALTLRPKLWTLSQKSDCRIFRGSTSPQIVETLCKEHGISDFELRITGQPIQQDYSVQWNETDLAYMQRRMQEDGLFYWFDHKQGAHTLVVADHASGYDSSSEPQVRFTEGSPAQDYISQWRRSFAFTPGKRTGRDWNFLTMSTPEATQPSFATVPGNAQAELYEFPGRFADSWGAEQMEKNRIQATETGFETVEAVSTVRTLGPAEKFTPKDVAKPSNTFTQQVVTAIRHEAEDRTYETNAGVPSYSNSFEVVPATTPATPHRTVPRPKIIGSQIALVAGPPGEEIFTDQFGRVKVWFPWDRRAKRDGSDTCWMRVGQPWAGASWGHQVIPRVGMECLISYQEGDPDRPFVTALVPDPTNKVPYTLPTNKTRMVFRSNSYKSQGFNEMTFEDATGGENMFFHAQKDHTTRIENNQTNSVGANLCQVVGQSKALTVGTNQTEEIGGSANLIVGAIGAEAAGLMAPFAGIGSQTANLLSQSLGVAANGAVGSATTAALVPGLANSIVGILSAAGQNAQANVSGGQNPRTDAGTALAAAGGILGGATQDLFSLPGTMNTIVGAMKIDSVGVDSIEQIGTSKVTNVGQTYAVFVGKASSFEVGETASTRIGQMHVVEVGGNSREAVGAGKLTTAGQTIGLIAGQSVTLAIGDDSCRLSLDGSGTLTLQANKQIVLKAGSAQLVAGPDEIQYQPTLVQKGQ